MLLTAARLNAMADLGFPEKTDGCKNTSRLPSADEGRKRGIRGIGKRSRLTAADGPCFSQLPFPPDWNLSGARFGSTGQDDLSGGRFANAPDEEWSALHGIVAGLEVSNRPAVSSFFSRPNIPQESDFQRNAPLQPPPKTPNGARFFTSLDGQDGVSSTKKFLPRRGKRIFFEHGGKMTGRWTIWRWQRPGRAEARWIWAL